MKIWNEKWTLKNGSLNKILVIFIYKSIIITYFIRIFYVVKIIVEKIKIPINDLEFFLENGDFLFEIILPLLGYNFWNLSDIIMIFLSQKYQYLKNIHAIVYVLYVIKCFLFIWQKSSNYFNYLKWIFVILFF